MKCRRCRAKAVIHLPRHNSSFCPPCFNAYVVGQVERAIRDEKMFTLDDRIAVAVSGGKDSLALWDLLLKAGYTAHGLHIDLGIGPYSARSREKARAFATSRGVPLIIHDLREQHGNGVTELATIIRRSPCSACGTMKRYSYNRIASQNGFSVLATGHNLDDEASRLLGNVLHWQQDYLAKQAPMLPATRPGLVRKVKPLYRLAEREVAAYAVLNRIDYIIEECPNAKGAKMLLYKEALNKLEEAAPGTKHAFYLGFLKEQRGRTFAGDEALRDCRVCGQPTTAEVCAYCRMVQSLEGARVTR